MSDQLALVDVPVVEKPKPAPKVRPLSDRQEAVLVAVAHAGHDGLSTDECGAIAHGLKEGRWAHGPDDRCLYCGRDGRAILLALHARGLVRYRAGKLKVWQLAELPRAEPEPAESHDGTGAVPYNTFPQGF